MVLNLFTSNFGFFGAIMLVWVIAWKGWALWVAARKDSKPWYVALLIINTIGVLEILYIFYFSKKREKKTESKVETETSSVI